MLSATSDVIRPPRRRGGLVLLWGFALFAMAVAVIATGALGREAEPWTRWFVLAMWIVVAYLVSLSAYETWRALAHGDALLRLDSPAPHAGGWLSGTLELTKLPRSNISLHVECVRSTMDVDRSKNIRTILWQRIVILDPARIGEAGGGKVIPFAVWIPAESLPTSAAEETDVDWNVRVEAGGYVQQFDVPVLAADAASIASSQSAARPPRETPEMPAARLAELTTDGSRSTIDLPFPFVSVSLATLFLIVAVSIPLATGASPDVLEGVVFATGSFLALFALTLLVVANTPRRVEIEGEELRIRRGVLGLGFHSRLLRQDVVKVEEQAPRDATSTAFYGVQLRTRDGRLHAAAVRLKDPARAKGVAAAIESALAR
jgi:hypothetical protein